MTGFSLFACPIAWNSESLGPNLGLEQNLVHCEIADIDLSFKTYLQVKMSDW